MLRQKLLIATLLLACFACAREPMPRTEGKHLSSDERAQCTSQGGKPGQVLTGVEGCIRPTTDGGKSCTDGSQCQGTCNAPPAAKFGDSVQGTCSAEVQHLGCVNLVVQGLASGEVCFK